MISRDTFVAFVSLLRLWPHSFSSERPPPHLLSISRSKCRAWTPSQTYYKLTYVDRRIDNPEQRICEDIPYLASGLGDLLREWCNASVDAIFYAWMLRSYSRTNKYTATIIGYVFGAGVLTTIASPNFGRLYKRQSENEGRPALESTDGLNGKLRRCHRWLP
jgi:hypothetical protein